MLFLLTSHTYFSFCRYYERVLYTSELMNLGHTAVEKFIMFRLGRANEFPGN